jgi:hypothetical protein
MLISSLANTWIKQIELELIDFQILRSHSRPPKVSTTYRSYKPYVNGTL